MGALTGGLAGFDCASVCAGGIKRIWLTNEDDIDSITFGVNGEVTAITMVVGKVFFEVKLKVNTKQLVEQADVTEDGCGVTFTQTFTGIAACYDQDTRTFLLELAKQSCCGLVAIHEENSGFVALWGHIEDLPIRLGGGTNTDTGANLTDPNQVTIELVCTTTAEGLKTEFTPGVAGIPV